jgi:hypothetical protein
MTIEYLVLRAFPEESPFASVITGRGKQFWDTLQDAYSGLRFSVGYRRDA